jgi:hypothetical protein
VIPPPAAVPEGLTLSRIPWTYDYQLKRNSEVLGTLRRPALFSLGFLAESQHGQWTFRRSGCLCGSAQILDSASQQQIATFQSPWGGGETLTFADGQTFQLRCKGRWRPVWSVIGKDGRTVLHLHSREKTVDIKTPMAVTLERLSLLILFAWYRILQADQDATSAALVAVIAAS